MRLKGFIIMIAAMAALAGCASMRDTAMDDERSRQLAAQIDELLASAYDAAKDNPEGTLGVYRHIAALDPSRWEAGYNAGLIYMERGDREKAEKELLEAHERKSPADRAASALGVLYHAAGKTGKAIGVLESALSHGRSAPALINLAYLKQSAGKSDEAVKLYMEAEALDPANPIIHYNLGLLLYKTGQYEKSASRFEKTIAAGKKDGQAIEAYAQSLIKLRKYEEALVVLKQLNQLDPAAAVPYKNMGIIYEIFFGDYANAESNYSGYLRSAKGFHPDVEAWTEVVKAKAGHGAPHVAGGADGAGGERAR